MKKLLVALVVTAVALGYAFTVNAEETKVQTKVKTTSEGTVKTETAKVKTPEMKEKVKSTTTTTAEETVKDTKVTKKLKEGDVKKETIKTETETAGTKTTKETKISMKPREGDVKKETVTIKTFNEYDPAKDTDNTVTVIQDQKVVELPLTSNWKENHLKKFKSKEVTITSTYNPKIDVYIVKDIQLLEKAEKAKTK